MSIDSVHQKICELAYSDDVPESLRFRLLGFLTRQEMDFVDLGDFPDMKAYLRRFKNLFTQYEMYDGHLSEKEKCELILLSLPGGYLSLEDGAANLGVYEHLPTLMAELLRIERTKEVEAATRAEGGDESPVERVYERKNKRLKIDEGSTFKDNSAPRSFSQGSAGPLSSSESSI